MIHKFYNMEILKKAFVLVGFLCFLGFSSFSQTEDGEAEDEVYEAIELSRIPDYNSETTNRLLEVNLIVKSESKIEQIEEEVAFLRRKYDTLFVSFKEVNIDQLTLAKLDDWTRKWQSLNAEVSDIYDPISTSETQAKNIYNELDRYYNVWLETILTHKNSNIPDDLKLTVKNTKNDVRELRNRTKEKQGEYLSLKTECNSLSNKIFTHTNKLRIGRDNIMKNLLVAEQDVLWKAFRNHERDSTGITNSSIVTEYKNNARDFLAKNVVLLIVGIIILVIFIILFYYLQYTLTKAKGFTQALENNATRLIIKRPVLAGITFTWMFTSIVFDLPDEIKIVWNLFMLPIAIILLIELFGKQPVLTLVLFALFYAFRNVEYFLNSALPVVRVVYLIITIFSVFLIFKILKHLKNSERLKRLGWIVRLIFNLLAILLVGAFFFNIAGNVVLADIIMVGSIEVILNGILIVATFTIFYALIKLFFLLPKLQLSNIIKNHGQHILQQIKNILAFIFLVSWLNYSLHFYGIHEEVTNLLKGILSHSFELGTTSFSLNSVFAFLITIYLTIWLSKTIRMFLNEEVFERRKTPKGASSTITLLFRFAITSLGFLMALAFAGIGLENITIIISAFGVGIGFGLQNIFNNLISGLILAFERPIKVDDIIQVGELTGVVKEIGFRSSTVRTYDGSEVIVPNGDIISNQMINWTLSDRKRRLKIDLNLARETDPELVIQLLNEITLDNKDIVQTPAPRPLFLGYDDGTLNFQLLFWISDFDNSFGVATETMLKIHKKLKENNIDVPYPQRNIRIVDEEGIILNKK